MVEYHTQIRLHQTDAAGVLFFASLLHIAHDAYEAFLQEIKFPIQRFLKDLDFFLPIVHTEADYLRPLVVGDAVTVRTIVSKIGETSFTLSYEIFNPAGQKRGQVLTVHVCVSRKNGKKIHIPADLKKALSSHIQNPNLS